MTKFGTTRVGGLAQEVPNQSKTYKASYSNWFTPGSKDRLLTRSLFFFFKRSSSFSIVNGLLMNSSKPLWAHLTMSRSDSIIATRWLLSIHRELCTVKDWEETWLELNHAHYSLNFLSLLTKEDHLFKSSQQAKTPLLTLKRQTLPEGLGFQCIFESARRLRVKGVVGVKNYTKVK